MRRRGSFAGGIDLPDFKGSLVRGAIEPGPRLAELRVPLAPCGGPAAEPVVEPGSQVAAGQLLARAGGADGVDIFAPAAGRVGGLTAVQVVAGIGFAASPALSLHVAEPPEPILSAAPKFDWRADGAANSAGRHGDSPAESDGERLRRRLAEGQLVTCSASPAPLAGWIDAARKARVTTVVLNAVECEPYVVSDHRLLAQCGDDAVRGLLILAAAIGARRTLLAVDQRHVHLYDPAVAKQARAAGIEPVAMAPKYPVGNDVVLLKVLTGREVPLGGGPFDIGCAVTNVATCFAAYRWAACGLRQTSRVVTLAGGRLGRTGAFHVPFGADCRSLAGAAGPRGNGEAATRDQPLIHGHPRSYDEPLILGGPMTGRLCPEAADIAGALAASQVAMAGCHPQAERSGAWGCGQARHPQASTLEGGTLVVTAGTDALVGIEASPAANPSPCIRCSWCVDHCPARLNVAALNDYYELGQMDAAAAIGVEACVGCGVCTYVCPAQLPLSQRVKEMSRTVRGLAAREPLLSPAGGRRR